MADDIQKKIVVPVDGSENALKSLDYINLLFGPQQNIKTTLFYVMPRLPSILVEEIKKSNEKDISLHDIEDRNAAMAQSLLKAAKDRLLGMGFTQDTVEAVFRKIEVGIARDIVHWSEKKKADAVIITTRGRSRLETFFMGETAAKVLEYSRICPVWMLKGTIKHKHVLIAIDNSKNAMRAVDHAAFMLAGTDANISIFHSKRDVRRFVPYAVLNEFPEVQKYWQRKAGEVMVPFMQKAKDKLLAAGFDKGRVEVKTVDGSRQPAADILTEAEDRRAGTIFMGLRGYSEVTAYKMGSVSRKVLNQAHDMAVSIVP
jgi:nucleotide-binding universal stress UspA family protein